MFKIDSISYNFRQSVENIHVDLRQKLIQEIQQYLDLVNKSISELTNVPLEFTAIICGNRPSWNDGEECLFSKDVFIICDKFSQLSSDDLQDITRRIEDLGSRMQYLYDDQEVLRDLYQELYDEVYFNEDVLNKASIDYKERTERHIINSIQQIDDGLINGLFGDNFTLTIAPNFTVISEYESEY